MTLSVEKLRAALEAVVDPIFERTLKKLGSIESLDVAEGMAKAVVAISSPAQPMQSLLRKRIDEALKGAGSATNEVELIVRVPTRQTDSNDVLPKVRNVIMVMSGKGGVGKSTTATNLALALRRIGVRVGLLDADIYGPSIPTMLGIEGHPDATPDKRIKPMERFGIKMMSIGFLIDDPTQAIIWRGPMLHGALGQFMSDVDWGELDFLIIDMPPGTGDVALTMAQKTKVSGVIMVTTPQEVALQDVFKSTSMCKKLNLPMLGVIENMSYFVDSAGQRHNIFGEGGGAKIAEFAESELLGQIPIETAVREWGDKGTPIVQAAPESDAAKAYAAVAEKLATDIARSHFDEDSGKAPTDKASKHLRIVR